MVGMINSKPSALVRGAKAIAEILEVSPITVMRWAKKGPLKGLAYKPNGKTSPLTIVRADAERVRGKMREVAQ
jgi:predicted site-specific integrase-resolvase